MPDLNIGKTSTTGMDTAVDTFSVSAVTPDQESPYESGFTWYDFPDSDTYLGYYKEIPEIKSAIHVLAQRVCGLGYTAESSRDQVILERLQGWGEDDFSSICMNLLTQKKIFGDAFAEIIRNDNGTLLNIKPLYTGNMRVVVDKKGLIDHYEIRTKNRNTRLKPEQVLHLCNDRIANEIHGISVIESLKTIIDAKNEALTDEKKIRHRELALGVLEVDTDDTDKINTIISKYQDAVNKGEVLVTMKGTAELKDNPNTPRDRIQWLQYLDNLFYQVIGTPKVLVTSEGFTEAGGKAGLLAFEPTEISEKQILESDLWNQIGVRVKFTKTPSLLGEAIGTEQKNAGQTGIQPNETEVRPTRTE